MTNTSSRYRVMQLGKPDQNRIQNNEFFRDFDQLVTHHPDLNRNAKLVDGVPVEIENERKRSYAVIGGEIQEIEARRTDEYRALNGTQVLLIKDFILEDSRVVSGARSGRNVDVPAPVSGYVGRVHGAQGVVDIYDRKGGEVIARIRHMDPIHVREGDNVEYGQALGTQSNKGLDYPPGIGIHVHAEVDTRYYQHYENYISDLLNGRLSVDKNRRGGGIVPLPVFDDGTFRVGEANPRIQQFQEELISRGYSGAHGKPLRADGVYRLDMQPAVLAFQQDHGLARSGDIDRSTLHVAFPLSRREVDRMDHVERSRMPFAPEVRPGEPIHDYRPGPDDYRRPPEHLRAEPGSHCLTPNHPDFALYEAIRKALPEKYSDDMAAHVMLQTKIGGVAKADDIDKIIVRDERIFVMGTTPGFRTDVYLSQAPPPMQETVQRSDEFDKQQAQQRQQWLAQEQQLSQDRGMRYSL